MEFPWSAIGAIFAAITLAVLLGYNIPKFVKQFSIPKINIDLFIYPEKTCKQKGVPQSDKPQIFDKEIEVLPNISPQFLVRINPKWKYTVSVIEVIGWSKSMIKRINLFSTQKRFWLEKEFTEIEGNYKVFPNITIRKGHTTDPLLLDLQIDPPFEKGEQRKMTVRVSTEESRKQLEKDFLIKASA